MGLTQGLHRAVQQTPALPATICMGRVQTWAQCADRVARLASALVDLGIRPGDRVAMLSLNSDYYHEYLLGVPWAGAVLNPVNTRWSPSEIAYSLVDSQTQLLIVDDTFAAVAARMQEKCPDLRRIIYCGESSTPAGMLSFEQLIADHDGMEDAYLRGTDAAGIFYTGGSTGAPKGVVLSHAGLLTSALGFTAHGDTITRGGTSLHVAPMFHLADIGAWVSRNCVGGGHVMVPGFNPATVIDAVDRYRVTDLLLVPTMLQMLVDSPAARRADLSSIEHLVYGGSPISVDLIARVEKVMPAAKLVQAYGMTELSPVITILDADGHRDARLRRSAGRAAPHSEVRVVDDRGRSVPLGAVGELIVRGDNLMLGYWNEPQQTAEVMKEGWMHTGDVGYMDECGYVFIVDRLKDMIVSGGENVYSAEVENALSMHPSVASCAVIGIPDERWGERVHAVIVTVPGSQATAEELRAHCKTVIASYKAPRTLEFVDALPISGVGKVLKQDLRARYWPTGERAVH